MVTASSRILAAHAGHIAAGVVVCFSMAMSCGLTAWMHNLLSYSHRHPVPAGASCDYGVVLGYALHRNGSCTRPLQSRVEVGVQAYKKGAVKRLLFSGSHDGGVKSNISEANAMQAYALSLVFEPPESGRWILEELSTSTRTNAVYSLRIIKQQQLNTSCRTVVLVTNPFHQLRSYFTFRKAAREVGLDVQFYVAEAPFAGHHGYGNWLMDGVLDQYDFWREVAAIALYAVKGYLW